MKRIVFLVLLAVCGWFSTAWCGSGFFMEGDYEGIRYGLLFYYDNSFAPFVDEFNSELVQAFREEGFRIYRAQPMSEGEIFDLALDVMSNGAESRGWDICLGFVFYYVHNYYWSYIQFDAYALGYEGSPVIYLDTYYYYF